MKRTFLLPASAAAVGILMALGVFALKRAAVNAWEDQTFHFETDGPFAITMDAGEVAMQGEAVQEILAQVREEIRLSVETKRNLSDAERARLEAALAELDVKIERARARVEEAVEAADAAAPPAPDAPAAPDTPAAPGGN